MSDYQENIDYAGYIDVTEEQDKVSIYFDTGNVDDGMSAVHGVLYAINEVPGVESVVINEM